MALGGEKSNTSGRTTGLSCFRGNDRTGLRECEILALVPGCVIFDVWVPARNGHVLMEWWYGDAPVWKGYDHFRHAQFVGIVGAVTGIAVVDNDLAAGSC